MSQSNQRNRSSASDAYARGPGWPDLLAVAAVLVFGAAAIVLMLGNGHWPLSLRPEAADPRVREVAGPGAPEPSLQSLAPGVVRPIPIVDEPEAQDRAERGPGVPTGIPTVPYIAGFAPADGEASLAGRAPDSLDETLARFSAIISECEKHRKLSVESWNALATVLDRQTAIVGDLRRLLALRPAISPSLALAMRSGRLELVLCDNPRTVVELVYVTPGSFRMGFSKEEQMNVNLSTNAMQADTSVPQFQVNVRSGYFIGRCEVTNAQYYEFLRQVPHLRFPLPPRLSRPDFDGDEPVAGVNWREAAFFCQWLGQRNGCTARLPTEMEWEYAARGRGNLRFACADGFEFRNAGGASPHRVGGEPRDQSWCGAMDMSANVSEWCLDLYRPEVYKDYQARGPYEYEPQAIPQDLAVQGVNNQRVYRGGYFQDPTANCLAAIRRPRMEDERRDSIGFRVAVILPAPPQSERPEPAASAKPQAGTPEERDGGVPAGAAPGASNGQPTNPPPGMAPRIQPVPLNLQPKPASPEPSREGAENASRRP